MDARTSTDSFLFGQFRLDRLRGLFRCDPAGDLVPVSLGSRALDVLRVLIERHGDLVSKDEIMATVWPNIVVEEANLTVQISALRRVLDQGSSGQSCIQTVPGRGYRFVLAVTRAEDARSDPASASIVDTAPTQETVRWSRLRWHWLVAWGGFAAVLVMIAVPWTGGWFTSDTRSRLSLVVLPFENLSDDRSEDYLADAITDDVTTDLSRVPGMFVIARESAFTFQGKAVDVRKIGKELGVRYVVEGSVRRQGDALRVNAQLVDSETGAQLWADRFDQPLKDLNTGQEDIVRRIGQTLNVALWDVESARSRRERPTNPDAFDLIIRARSLRNGLRSRQQNEQALALYERALELDPASVQAKLGIARILIDRNLEALGQWTAADDVARAGTLIAEAQLVQPTSEDVLIAAAELAQAQERWTDLIFAAQRVIDLYPNRAEGYELLGMAKRLVGSLEEAIQLYEKSVRLDPREPNMFLRCSCMAYALLLVGRYEEAIRWFERSLAANPKASNASRGARYSAIAAAYVLSGRLDEGQAAMHVAEQLSPYMTARMSSPENPRNSVEVAQKLRIADAWRQLGMPDHAVEDADFGVQDVDTVRRDLAGPTPTEITGARTIRTSDLVTLLGDRRPIVIDTALYSWGRSIPGAIGLKNAGLGGNYLDKAQEQLRRKMQELTKGDPSVPIVTVGFNSLRFDGRNLALRLVALGYKHVYWYRGGREAWEVAGLPETALDVQGW